MQMQAQLNTATWFRMLPKINLKQIAYLKGLRAAGISWLVAQRKLAVSYVDNGLLV